MSEMSENELSNIELCYKAMGLSFSDNPEQVERTYRKLKEQYGKAMRSADPSERAGANENLKQLEELFTTITGSVIYKDYAREYAKYKESKAEEQATRKQKQVEKPVVKDILVNCPYCHKLISPKLKVCMYCRGKILTPMEKMIENFFTTKSIIIITVVLLLIAVGVLVAMNPLLFK